LIERAENDDERELTAQEANLAALRSLKSTWDTLERLKTSEIPTLKTQLVELEEHKRIAADAQEAVSTSLQFVDGSRQHSAPYLPEYLLTGTG
jgi:DNA repair protein RAD50